MESSVSQALVYDAKKKSPLVAYMLWFWLGTLGMHRFYAGKTTSAIIMLVLGIVGYIGTIFIIGIFILIPVLIWVLLDVFFISGWIRNYNLALISTLPS